MDKYRRTGRTTRMLEIVAIHALQNKRVCVIAANHDTARTFAKHPIIAEFVKSGLVEIIPPHINKLRGKRYDHILIDHYVAEVTPFEDLKEIKHIAKSTLLRSSYNELLAQARQIGKSEMNKLYTE